MYYYNPIPALPVPTEGQVLPPDVLNTHTAWVKASKEIAGLMLITMDPDIQKNLEHLGPYDMLKELKTLYAQQADYKLLQTVREITRANRKKGSLSLENELSHLSRRVDETEEAISRSWHLSKKRIEKLQHNGLLDSTDIKSFEKCVSCMSGKMARKSYSHQVERDTDLIGLIYTDEHVIIAHRTPPYTPQHNGASDRRIRTLLDMVRSMMTQTTLPKSFWNYAFESAACIINMVPTKKVDKTPYKI
uniref:Zinc finger, CCHC-type n=1 Tax=Tanacetum cinerariifolium TaxID=118510 RepID=A0A699HID6_TANCI|nr:zinc finger, CCHC-type [Tanacetum cinerariifolium]GEY32454.1 zinc finger, CCHC-type [Tanacetum cinerariifolium]